MAQKVHKLKKQEKIDAWLSWELLRRSILLDGSNPMTDSEVAMACGFSSKSSTHMIIKKMRERLKLNNSL